MSLRILHIAHQQLRKYGHLRVSWAQKLYHGLIRNDHLVQGFSDRDIAAFEAPFGIRDLGKKKANQRLLQTVEAFQPDLIIVGHCDIISNETLIEARKQRPSVIIAACNNDPLFAPENVKKIEKRCQVVDAMFVSTGLKELTQFHGSRARLFHMPNPVDISIETENNASKDNLAVDLLFCSKETAYSCRGEIVHYLKERLPEALSFSTPGSFQQATVWGRDYDTLLGQAKMGLNLNRQEGFDWYSSARMAQLAGNGLLTFTHRSSDFSRLFPAESLVYFDHKEDLRQKVEDFFNDDNKRQHWAARARSFFHSEINSTLYAQYIVEAATQSSYSHRYVWLEDERV